MNIVVTNKNVKMPKELIKACNDNEIMAKILYNRGIKTVEALKKYTDYRCYSEYDVFEFPPMLEACKIIKEAIENKEKIAVYGDYDVDGITATSVLMISLKRLGAVVIYHVPDRFSEGYGMNLEVVEKMNNDGVKTIITCDCGISNINEIARAKELGMKVILTDHHNIGETIPNADVVINYKLLPDGHPVKNISGCATAYLLVNALYKYLGVNVLDDCIDLVALSIISDVIPLRDESRYLFQKGFEKIKFPDRIGLKSLEELINIENISVDDIGFQIVPRLNAVGRMDNARTAVELFMTEDKKEADRLALEIDRFNTDRKNIQNEIYAKAKEIVETEKKNKKILILFSEGWHHGVLGIVAGKICEEYDKPCIVLSTDEEGNVVGSARSTEQLNIYDTLTRFSEYLIKYGGHSQAAGLSLKLENLPKFTEEIEKYADIYLAEDYEKTSFVDCILPFSMIDEKLLESLALGEPYGEGFLEPKFVTPKVKITKETINKGTHHFMTLIDSTKREIGTTLWNYGPEELLGRECTIIYGIYKDTYNGRNEIKIKIQDILFDNAKIVEDNFEYIYRRGVDIADIIKEYEGCSIFYEGPEMLKPQFPTINSKYNEKISTLVLYSVPKSNKILHELIENTCPNRVVIEFAYIPNYDMIYFQKIFMGIIKNAVNNFDGVISIENAATIMQVDEEFIVTYSELLAEYGYIDFKKQQNNIIYSIVNDANKSIHRNAYLENIVTRYLKERAEYIKYMADSPIYDKNQEE